MDYEQGKVHENMPAISLESEAKVLTNIMKQFSRRLTMYGTSLENDV